MLELIKKTLLTGVGLAVVTKEKIEELSNDLVKKGQLSEQEGRQFIDDLLKKSEQAQKDLETRIENSVHSVVDKLNLVTKDDVAALEAKIEALEEKRGAGE